MENRNDFDFIKAQLDSLPEITLPTSLTAESLWARVDAGELSPEDGEPARGSLTLWVKKMRPVLSYAAVFIVMVAVYYSAGLDSSPTAMPAPAEASPQMMMASPNMEDVPAAGPQPRMAAAQDIGESSLSSMADMPMLADAPAPDGNTKDATANPDTSLMMSPEDRAKMEEENRQRYENYQRGVENATSMEKYLLSVLSSKDYGGMNVRQSDDVSLHIWVVNTDVVNAAISLYPPDSYKIVTETARCSLEDMKAFAGLLERISLTEGENLHAYISETDNTVAVNITKKGEDRLRENIGALIQESGIPSECVTIFTIDPDAPNPDT